MPTKSTRLRDNVAALAALQYDHARIVDGRVTDAQAAAILLQAVQAHVRALVACTPNPRPAQTQPAVVDTSTMTDAQLYAYYKRTALVEDLRFFLRGGKSAALRARAEAITNPTARDLASLREAWRVERCAEDRAAGIPAIGTEEWHRQTRGEPMSTQEVQP
jgi:hypothetical protein